MNSINHFFYQLHPHINLSFPHVQILRALSVTYTHMIYVLVMINNSMIQTVLSQVQILTTSTYIHIKQNTFKHITHITEHGHNSTLNNIVTFYRKLTLYGIHWMMNLNVSQLLCLVKSMIQHVPNMVVEEDKTILISTIILPNLHKSPSYPPHLNTLVTLSYQSKYSMTRNKIQLQTFHTSHQTLCQPMLHNEKVFLQDILTVFYPILRAIKTKK